MGHSKAIVAATGIAVLSLISLVLVDRNSVSVSAGEKTSFLNGFSVAQRPATLTLPAGTTIHIRLLDAVSTDKDTPGDHFTATLDRPLMVDRKVVAPSQSKVTGILTTVKESGRVSGRARLTMVLKKVSVDNKEYDLESYPLKLDARSTVKRDAAVIAGGSAVGAAIGAIAGGGKGAAIGAGIGGGSGTGYVLGTQGAPVAYGPEARFTFTLAHPVELPIYH